MTLRRGAALAQCFEHLQRTIYRASAGPPAQLQWRQSRCGPLWFPLAPGVHRSVESGLMRSGLLANVDLTDMIKSLFPFYRCLSRGAPTVCEGSGFSRSRSFSRSFLFLTLYKSIVAILLALLRICSSLAWFAPLFSCDFCLYCPPIALAVDKARHSLPP